MFFILDVNLHMGKMNYVILGHEDLMIIHQMIDGMVKQNLSLIFMKRVSVQQVYQKHSVLPD